MNSFLKKQLFICILCITAVLLAVLPVVAEQSGMQIPDQATGDLAYSHVEYLSEVIGARVAGSEKEAETRDYIAAQFESLGYDVEVQPFSYIRRGQVYHSANVIATIPGRMEQTVIVGAHYDSVPARTLDGQTLTGAGDNASGVGVMLEAAALLAEYKTQATVKFVAFGAEEVGLRGSRYFASQMTTEEIANAICMINLDCVGVGDFFYVYAGIDGNPGWVRDMALSIGQGLGLDLRTSPESEHFEYGTTGDWSDHVPFRVLGIPIAYFEWMNWDIEPNGGIETEEYGWIMHTAFDNLSLISKEKLEQTVKVLSVLLHDLSRNPAAYRTEGRMRAQRFTGMQERYLMPE